MKCKNKVICLKCAGNHKTRECYVNKINYSNSAFSNSKYNTDFNMENVATDCHECQILQAKICKYIDFADYTIKPLLPISVGTVERT